MNTEMTTEEFLKAKLEEGVRPSPATLAAIGLMAAREARPVRRPWWQTSIAAAVVVAVFGLAAVLVGPEGSSRVDPTTQAISLLLEANDFEADSASAADLLLAWQDAPYAEALASDDSDAL